MIEGIVSLIIEDTAEAGRPEGTEPCEGSTCEGDSGCMCQYEG